MVHRKRKTFGIVQIVQPEGLTIPHLNTKKSEVIEGFFCQTKSPMRSILSVCEQLGYSNHSHHTRNFLSEGVRCGASQKKDLRDSTNRTARRSLLLEMCRRLRLITRNYFWFEIRNSKSDLRPTTKLSYSRRPVPPGIR